MVRGDRGGTAAGRLWRWRGERQTLPDGEAMTGWKETARPTAVEMDKLYRSQACPIKDNAGCENSRFYGASTFRHDDNAATVTFLIIAYDSEQAAREAYDVLWDGYRVYSQCAGLQPGGEANLEEGAAGPLTQGERQQEQGQGQDPRRPRARPG
ncbi:hypothetical protein ABZ467_39260, partial [Streptomyces sp. NPDC005727]